MNNSITLVGYVGQNPKVRTFPDTGNKVVKFSIAVREYTTNGDDATTMWVDVDAWNQLGDRVLKTLTQGREVVVNGRLAINHYTTEEDGVTKEFHKPVIKLTGFHACGKKPPMSKPAQPAMAIAN